MEFKDCVAPFFIHAQTTNSNLGGSSNVFLLIQLFIRHGAHRIWGCAEVVSLQVLQGISALILPLNSLSTSRVCLTSSLDLEV